MTIQTFEHLPSDMEDDNPTDVLPQSFSGEPRAAEPIADIEVICPTDDLDPMRRELADGFMRLREDYVRAQGWKAGPSEADRYDTDPDTLYVINSAQADGSERRRIIAGMRMTRVDGVKASLSWEMLGQSLQDSLKKQAAETINWLDEIAKTEGLWDLTRFVAPSDGSASLGEISKAILEEIGVGIAESANKTGKRPQWLFLTTEAFKGFLDVCKIKHDVLTSSKIDADDKTASYLILADPVLAYNYVQEHSASDRFARRTFDAVTSGLRSR